METVRKAKQLRYRFKRVAAKGRAAQAVETFGFAMEHRLLRASINMECKSPIASPDGSTPNGVTKMGKTTFPPPKSSRMLPKMRLFVRSMQVGSCGPRRSANRPSWHRPLIQRTIPKYVALDSVPLHGVINDALMQWCSMCCDYGPYMILCAGCRVAVCSGGAISEIGCLKWEPFIEDPEFIYYCPFCVSSMQGKTRVCDLLSSATVTWGICNTLTDPHETSKPMGIGHLVSLQLTHRSSVTYTA